MVKIYDNLTQGTEEWLPVVGYEGIYEVSDQGNVRSLDRIDNRGNQIAGRMRKPRPLPSGHLMVILSSNSIRSPRLVHRLVLEAFVGPCPPGMECCHYDDDPTNNSLENLRWDTSHANKLDMVRNGNHPQSRKDACPSGHLYTAENTKLYAGRRYCRECHREHSRSYQERKRAERNAA